jgi:predicted MPP superfamily phosphohydrolase
MRLLHVSDIHFKAPDCSDRARDPENPVRVAMVRSVRERVESFGGIDAILITGDIAFRAFPSEYDVADEWFRELAEAASCSIDEIYVVPGNHDVHRPTITGTVAIKNAHAAILAADNHIERATREQLADQDTERALLAPLEAYNTFARVFDCAVLPGKWSWIHQISMGNGVVVRLHGITSTLLSGAIKVDQKQDDQPGGLYLQPHQFALTPQDDVINVVLAHHPPSWLRNAREFERAIENFAHLQFFGHEHDRRHHATPTFLRMFSNAVNPDRTEAGAPGYNLIRLETTGAGKNRALKIEFMELEWQNNPPKFRPVIYGHDTHTIFTHTIPFPGVEHCPLPKNNGDIAVTIDPPEEVPMVPPNPQPSWRNLIRRFWNLGVQQRHEIITSLGVTVAADESLSDLERSSHALERIVERNLAQQLETELQGRERA